MAFVDRPSIRGFAKPYLHCYALTRLELHATLLWDFGTGGNFRMCDCSTKCEYRNLIHTEVEHGLGLGLSLSRSHSLAFMIIVIGSWELKDVSEKTSDLFADIVADIIHVHVVRINRCVFESKIVDVVSVKRKKFERSGFGGKFENT